MKSQDYSLIESLLWDGVYHRLERHMQRLERSALAFGFPWAPARVTEALNQQERALGEALRARRRYKARLELDRTGKIRCEAVALEPAPAQRRLTILLSDQSTRSDDPLLFHKTTHRPLYDSAHQRALRLGHADIVFLNERGEITEGAISTLFVLREDRLLTPPVACGLLPGVYRQWVLDTNPQASEAILRPDDLLTADAIYICNAVRGWRAVSLATGRALAEEDDARR
ncbi:MAG TPA: aminotransferase class IV [Ktedonobacterales bacterium]|jgi:para-aminobenzoate synthetase / 4-amino-4-deoxychorismate lyase|nr:aminotransferase class IV [Ktedonobacterales bacterium]